MSLIEYDDLGRGHPRGGLWGMKCWNALNAEDQEDLVVTGKFRGYHRNGGGQCDNPAQVGIETENDRMPGSRFYCLPCGITYLKEQPNG